MEYLIIYKYNESFTNFAFATKKTDGMICLKDDIS